MNIDKKKYLGILAIVTLACIIAGSLLHAYRIHRYNRVEQTMEAAEEFADEMEDLVEGDEEDIDEKYDMKVLEGTQADGKNIPFTNIDMTLGAFDVNITTGQDYGVTYYVSQDELKPKAEIKDGTLYITQESRIKNVNSFDDLVKWLSSRTGVTAKMLITVPEGTDIGTLTFKNGAGDTDIKNVTIDALTAECSAGDIELAGCTVKDLYATVSAGDFEMSGTPNLADYNINLDASAGDIRIGDSKIDGSYVQKGKEGLKITVDSSAGDIEIR